VGEPATAAHLAHGDNLGACGRPPDDTHTPGDGGDQEKVCVLRKNKGDDHNNGEHKHYRWISEDKKHHGDKVVKDKFCKHKNNRGEHKDNDDNGHANKKDDDDNGHANHDD
jgi:hypothetical protein